MNALLSTLLHNSRTVLMIFSMLMLVGGFTLNNIPKENNPDISVPIIYVSITHEGISPEDSDRLLFQPLKKELKSVDGLKEMSSTAAEGMLAVTLEFSSDVDIDQALIDVRERVDIAKSKLPTDTDEPKIKEINVGLFPVMVVTLSGQVDEAALFSVARKLRDQLEGLPGVLEANIQGYREEVAEIIMDPLLLDSYNLDQQALFNLLSSNNQLVAAGNMDTGAGRFALKVPGLIQSTYDILNMPIKVDGNKVIKFQDIAVGRRTYKDPESIARVNGQPAVALEITKRLGANIIETLDGVKALVNEQKDGWPKGITVGFSQDESGYIKRALKDLFNNILSAILLVMIVIVGVMGWRTATLVSLTIPGSFLMAILILSMMGYTLNMVVLFALILSVGMLVDGAIVVTEYADRRMAEGVHRFNAYLEACKRMAWPIIASTATTLAVFFPLLFWPGTTGEFMKFLPLSLLFTLSASLVMALVVIPTLGTLVGKSGHQNAEALQAMKIAENGDLTQITGFTGQYLTLLRKLLARPERVLGAAIATLFITLIVYSQIGKGVEFFPEVDAQIALVDIQARGNLSLQEKDAIVREVEALILPLPEIETVYSKTLTRVPNDGAKDMIGQIQIELVDWQKRRTAKTILSEIEKLTSDIPGIVIETKEKQGGPAAGAKIQLEFRSESSQALHTVIEKVRTQFHQDPELIDIKDDRPLDGIEWQIVVDREQAARFGASIALIGSNLKMATSGLRVGAFRPIDADDEVEIRLRLPFNGRNLDQLDQLNIPINGQLVPISNFVKRIPMAKSGAVGRIDGERRYTLQANVIDGVNPTHKIAQIQHLLDKAGIPKSIEYHFRGDQEKMAETGIFLMSAFCFALFAMAVILVAQFNSFYHALLIMSAIVLSIAGVLIGLMLRSEPFGIVMSGMGVIALAGIVVNNNIVLIDTFKRLTEQGVEPIEAALRTGAQRMPPVLLTTVTTVLGLMPMVFNLNIDLIDRAFSVGAPSSQWWTQLSTAIAGGLTFATVLTLFLTPCLLVMQKTKPNNSEAKHTNSA
jgi:multidrug efflux pump